MWTTVIDSRTAQPDELDTTSSPTTVYQRRNIHQVAMPSMDGGDGVEVWEYEQQEISRAEWDNLNSLTTRTIMQSISDLQVDIALLEA